ncbi:MAG: HEAT repeat domain-containing protein [Rhabdochlamydiaceae bacterium]|nr:HEAT repeat domain-containing protein [Candidatus Amphrikana amoebophyrae]
MASSFSSSWWKRIGLYSLVFLSPILLAASEDSDIATISMFYKLGDYNSAKNVCQKALRHHPDSKKLNELSFRILAESGYIKEALSLIKEFPCYDKINNFNDLSLIETLAWGVLTNVSQSSENMQVMSMIGAFFTRDARAVNLILEHMTSRNALLRAHAVRASVMYRDDVLKDHLKKMLFKEKNYFVKLEVLRAVGALKIKSCASVLKEKIASDQATDEEKYHAIGALIQMYEDLELDEFNEMIASPRAGLRRAACDIVAHLEQKERIGAIFLMLEDSSHEVKISALNAIAILGNKGVSQAKLKERISLFINDTNAALSLTAEWVNIRLGLGCKESHIMEFLYDKNQRLRLFAASVLTLCGDSVESVLLHHSRKHFDPFVRLQLSSGLINMGHNRSIYLNEIDDLLSNTNVKLMHAKHVNPIFSSIAPSEVRHMAIVPQYPEMVDQLVRLDLINTLTIFNYAGAKSMLKEMLKAHSLNVIGNTASLLLEQGELESVELIRDLLNDEDGAVATQAALVLAFLGKDPSVVPTLKRAYATADWELKIQILEAMGRIGEHEAIPFLIERIEEPFQLLKIVAASSLIQCLYH